MPAMPATATAPAAISLHELQRQFHSLPRKEQREFAEFIETELVDDDIPTTEQQLTILKQRVRQVESGEVKMISSEEMERRLADLLQ